MTPFELLYTLAAYLEHPLYQRVRRELKRIDPAELLDVGGRRSNYTVGLQSVTISDVPRVTSTQHALDLGATDKLRDRVLKTRSNVAHYVYDDMSRTRLLEGSYDAVNATEVLEHVDDDEAFVRNVARVLAPGGVFVMTTPNGDRTPVPYPDHKRHYTRAQLVALLRRHFSDVRVEYIVNAGVLHNIGYRFPYLGTWAYALSAVLERLGWNRGAMGTHHLVAVGRK